ncbi:glutamyl-tRNA(Gln) amidotransferase, A subunit [Geobacter metallireducens RCH3]|uniref:Glutamyl-tRNA(Gln) amidotransferase subunit A n=1 Tax=Geobacter metallireducens (strain ATCC 53774 / DSM 7210 / GS-15) TaxID=269799 RepID=GATA_GEOMG|nr:Asp-tRNA(Asn)/Glu-tRNA(Gln) amidotransferase subunit GatA [Geobacter metallireducens]Q39ZK0.1 RecName: Full=Glutamyl-tRNA(Gln) amidotransferase subunit A; Short=Glu-ADT subunit A [Geobacter metallireducens GS-15]ABB30324.1 aspartyl/glutamyl-tRNA(Asn/Gln) amidotransferase, A subunit [Geobacter metallireducens GS-15]EHP84917.1 glutamyl-tRNA(Gln) amidotransferase, A subunit [Geobacter metallireducens RCH3]
MELFDLTIHELHDRLKRKELSSVEATRAMLARIEAVDPKVNAYITVTPEEALAAAEAADRRIAAGDMAPLTGIPVALKDIFVTKGIRTTCASKILDNFVPPYDGTAVAKLKEAGAVIVGKLNQDEFAMGSSGESSAFGPTRNPWNLECIPGGSSSGSAAAIAARTATATLGTDTGGSIRQPASHCGCVGLRPTYGRVSRYGVIAYASSLDQVGPVTRDVTDCALMLQAVAGHDPMDSTSVEVPVPDYAKGLTGDVKGLKLGLPKEYYIEGLDPDVKKALDEAIETYRGLGAEFVDISLPHTDYAVATYYLIATAEASSNLARYEGVRFGHRTEGAANLIDMFRKTRSEGFGDEVKRRIMIGTYALSSGYYDAYYLKAQKVRTLIMQDFLKAFEAVDAILTPVAPTPAFKIGEKTSDPLRMYLSDIFTIPVNLAGTCAVSVPAGMSGAGLPIGLQLIGRPFGEETILRAAHAFEQATAWHTQKAGI